MSFSFGLDCCCLFRSSMSSSNLTNHVVDMGIENKRVRG
jgi:hypothetical protein